MRQQSFNFSAGDRPGAPWASLEDRSASNLEQLYRPDSERVKLSRHHIIPWGHIRLCWNMIIERVFEEASVQLKNSLQSHVTSLRSQAPMWGMTLPLTDIDEACDDLDAFLRGEYIHDDKGRVLNGFSTFLQMMCWNPRNLFLGPATGDYRQYASWESMKFPYRPKWIEADPGETFEKDAAIIIERYDRGYFGRMMQIDVGIVAQREKPGSIDEAANGALKAFLDALVDAEINAEILPIRNNQWVRMRGYPRQKVWRMRVDGAVLRRVDAVMPELSDPPIPAYLIKGDPRIEFPVNDLNWKPIKMRQGVGSAPALIFVSEDKQAMEHVRQIPRPLQGYRPGESITIGGKTIQLDVSRADDDPDYLLADGVVESVTLTDAAIFLASLGDGEWELPPLFSGLRVDRLRVSFYQHVARIYTWNISAAIDFSASGFAANAVAMFCTRTELDGIETGLTIQLPIESKLISLSGGFRNIDGVMSAVLAADLTGTGVSISQLLIAILGTNPLPPELCSVSITPGRISLLYNDGSSKALFVALDFGVVQVFAGRSNEGMVAALRIYTGDVASFSSLPYVGSLIPASRDFAVSDVGVFWGSKALAPPTVDSIVAAQIDLDWLPFYPECPDGSVASGLHALARIATKDDGQSAIVQRHIQ